MQSSPYQTLVNLLSNILEAHTTAFFLVDGKNRRLQLAAVQTLSRYLPETTTLPMEQSGLLAQVHKVGQTIHLDKLQDITSALSAALPFYREGESHIKGLFATPVGAGDGVLYVDTKYSWGFNDKQRKWILEIAALLHELFERQESLKKEKNYARILGFLRRLDQSAFKGSTLEDYCRLVVEEGSQLLGTEYGFLAIREPGMVHYRLLATAGNVPRNLANQHYLIKQGLIGHIFQNHKPLFIPKLNPQAPEHFLLTSSEGLPHHGTFWGLPAQLSLGHGMVMGFLTRDPMEWGAEDQYAISHMMLLFQLLLEQFFFKEECEHLQAYDFCTGLVNALVFEARVEQTVTTCMQNSAPFTLALAQIEPWQVLYSKATPKQVRQVQEKLASSLRKSLPADALVGQITENRFGILLPETSAVDAKQYLASLTYLGQDVFAENLKRLRLQPYLSSVSFPQDGTRTEELWPAVYQGLFAAFQCRAE